ncbi:MAG TPA: ATP-binding cassette domain-containing protein [Clostridia bacterium]|nr:ATP-binding cassette domain-containing protein [Clostridia bacterium]
MLLEVKNIHKHYPYLSRRLFPGKKKFVALENINFQLERGKTLGIVGESGSGKSTLGGIVGDLRKPTLGEVLYKGKNIEKMTKEEYRDYRRNVQFIFQSPQESMNPGYSIKKVLHEPMDILLNLTQKEKEDRIDTTLSIVGLEKEILSKSPREISGGQAQRVAIARSIMLRPEIIICDEPTSALDVSIQAQALNLLRRLQEELGISYLFITHNMALINYMCDELMVLYKGKVVEQGPTEEVIQNPKEDYTKALMSFV